VVIFDGPDRLDEEAFEKGAVDRLSVPCNNLDVGIAGQHWNEDVDHDSAVAAFFAQRGGEAVFSSSGLHPMHRRPGAALRKAGAWCSFAHASSKKLRPELAVRQDEEIIRNRARRRCRPAAFQPNAQRTTAKPRSPPSDSGTRRSRFREWKCPFAHKK